MMWKELTILAVLTCLVALGDGQQSNCLGGQVFHECASDCTPTCSEPDPRVCSRRCHQRCICPTDKPIWHGNNCVAFSACGPCHRAVRANSPRPGELPMLGAFTPQCTTEGMYQSKQCHASTGYCWCANPDGSRIPDQQVGPGEPLEC